MVMMRKFTLVFAAAFFFVIAYPTIASAGKPSYKGNIGCKCHKSELEEWAMSQHGKAFESLLAINTQNSRKTPNKV